MRGVAASVVAVLSLAWPHHAAASGFQLREQSASKLGNAYAGAGSSGEDASILFYNPAGIALFDRSQSQVSLAPIAPHAEFDGQATDATGAPISGGNGGDAGTPGVVASLYLVAPVTERVNLGMAINTPFGQIISYDDGWVGRYHALTSSFHSASLTGVASFKVNDRLSIGGGPSLTYAQSRLTSAVDFGSLCVGSIGLSTCSGLGALPQQADGKVDLHGRGWGVGATAGLLYEPVKGTRIGLSWRSQVDLKLEGDADFDVPGNARILTSTGAFTDSGGSADVTLPETIGLSVHHDLNDRVAVMGDVVWTAWSRFEELRFVFDNPAQPDTVSPQNWNDTVFVAIGATWRPTDEWTLRTGVAYDQSPTEQNFRTPRLPDNDRYWVSVGADYRVAPQWTLSAGLTHIFVESSRLDISDPAAGRLSGTYDGSIDVISLGASLRF